MKRIMWTWAAIGMGLFVAGLLNAQPGKLSLVAGGPFGEGRNAREAHFGNLGQIMVHPQGGLVVSDNWRILRIDQNRVVSRLVGDLKRWYGESAGPALKQGLDTGRFGGFALDDSGAIYFAEGWVSIIRKLDPNGQVSTFAGRSQGFSGDEGRALAASLNTPATLARGPDGSLFIADSENNRIRKIDPNGVIHTVLGNGAAVSDGDGGPAVKASIRRPEFIAVDAAGNLFVSDSQANTIRLVTAADGIVRTYAGAAGRPGFAGDGGPAKDSLLRNPGSLAVDASGTLFIADRDNGRIRAVGKDGAIRTIAGGGSQLNVEAIPATEASLGYVFSVAVSSLGDLYLSEGFLNRIRVVSPDGFISTYAGADRNMGLGGPAAFARILNPVETAVDSNANTYVAEYDQIRRIDPSGRIEHYAGNPSAPVRLDIEGPAQTANLGAITDIALDPQENLVVLESRGRVLRIGKDGLVQRIAGLLEPGFEGDGGPALNAKFRNPGDIAIDSIGRIYIADRGNACIRMIDENGTIRTVVGDASVPGRSILVMPEGIAVDPNGDLLISDNSRHRIWRRSGRDGTVTPLLGDGNCSVLCWPGDLAAGRAGEIFLVLDGRLARILPGDRFEIFTESGWKPSGTNDRERALSLSARGISLAPNGDLLFSTFYDHKVWKVQGSGPFVATPFGMLFSFAQSAPPGRQSFSLEAGDGLEKEFSISASVPWLSVTPREGSLRPGTPVSIVVTADPRGLAKGTYSAKLTIRNPDDPAQRLDVPVTMTVSGTPQQMRLSQTGFAFAAIEATSAVATRSLRVFNTGTGVMNWRAAAQTLAGGNWLQVSPATGVSDAGRTAPELRVLANPSGLAPGVYFGLVTVSADGVDNSPQSATIILNVTRRDQVPGPVIEPAGLLFTNHQGPPTPQEVQIGNITTGELSYAVTLAFPEGTPPWAAVNGPGGRIAPGATGRVEVRTSSGLKAGVYTGELRIALTGESSPRVVNLVLVVADAGAGSAAAVTAGGRNAAGCEPKRLIPVFASPAASYQTVAGWPTAVTVRVVDDCAQPVVEGQVVVTFSTGDPPIRLVAEGDGRWSGTWAARTVGNRVTLVAQARTLSPVVEGSGRLEIGVREDRERPVIAPGGIRSLTSFREGRPVAASSPVAILGSRLAAEKREAAGYPLPAELAGTSALIAGRPLRLQTVGEDRMEGVLPANIADSTPLQMIVRRGNSYSVPEPVIVSEVEPGVFTANGTGVGQGMVFAVGEDGSRVLADLERPLRTGERMGILCTGLGPVDKPLVDGVPAPEGEAPQAVRPVVVTLQGKETEVIRAHLAAGMVGVYWIEATVPREVKADANADVVVRIGELESAPVTAAVLGEE